MRHSGWPARRATRSHAARSMAATHCASGPGSPVWMASTRSLALSVCHSVATSGQSWLSTSGATVSISSRARCSAPTPGKLHHTSPQPCAPSAPVTRTKTAGRSRIVPKDVTTGVAMGARSAQASMRVRRPRAGDDANAESGIGRVELSFGLHLAKRARAWEFQLASRRLEPDLGWRLVRGGRSRRPDARTGVDRRPTRTAAGRLHNS